jgi:23S rRNA pseudouridine2605 synthase
VPTDHPEGERLQKVMARAGLGSRRSVEEMIEAGRITVNGRVARLGARANPDTDVIEVDGLPAPLRSDAVYYLLNKQRGVVSTASDPQGRPTVVEAVPAEPRVFPVGRLDAETEGLLILTNDGELTNRLTHPSYGVAKEYLAEVEGRPSRGALRTLREGVDLDDGVTAAAVVSEISPGLLRLVIHEGRNRQVRRMCAAVGHPVTRLVRARIGPIVDRQLGPGEWRELTRSEVLELEREAAKPRGDEASPKPRGDEAPPK